MPGGDRTGPMGMGPMTGRAAGYCAGHGMPGFANPAPGRGSGMGYGAGRGYGMGAGRGWWGRGMGFFGGGRGHRRWFNATGLPGWLRFGPFADPYGYQAGAGMPDAENEKQALAAQAEALQAQIDAIRRRIDELK